MTLIDNPPNDKPVEAKGAAIDKVLETMHEKVAFGWIKNDGKSHDLPSHANGDSCVQEAKQAILAILAQEVKKARIDELTLINARFSTVRGAPKHKEMIKGYMLARDEFSRVKIERITELERLG